MPQRNPKALTSAITAVVDEVYGSSPCPQCSPEDPHAPTHSAFGTQAARRARLRRRLAPLLDGLLAPRQPITATEVTILLADLRGYTALSRSIAPKVMAELLNRWFALMCEIIDRCGGFVDKFMGDSVMALFGAPERHPDDLSRALACAVAMQHGMQRLNHESTRRGQPSLYLGVAINTGAVMAGSFGASNHRTYTVIGDAVNLAARIEAFSLRGQVLLSADSYQAARHLVEVGDVNHVLVKGLDEPLALYELLAVLAPAGPQPDATAGDDRTRRRMVIPRVDPRRSPRILVDLPAAFRPLAAKTILREPIIGRVLDLGYHGMCAQLPTNLPVLSEVVIALGGPDAPTVLPLTFPGALPDDAAGPHTGERVGDLYARVLRTRRDQCGYVTNLALTALGTAGQQRIKRLVDEQLWRR